MRRLGLRQVLDAGHHPDVGEDRRLLGKSPGALPAKDDPSQPFAFDQHRCPSAPRPLPAGITARNNARTTGTGGYVDARLFEHLSSGPRLALVP